MLLLCAVVVVILGCLIYRNYNDIKEYLRWRIMIEKLPKMVEKKFIVGHAANIFGHSNEDTWRWTREWIAASSSPIQTFYIGPFSVMCTVVGPDEIQAIISSMKNLQKALPYEFLREWLENGLLTNTGSKWQARRKILTPAFHYSILRKFVHIFKSETLNLVKEIEEKFLEMPVDITPLISNFTLLTINETSMGTKLDINTKEGMTYKHAVYNMGNIIYNRVVTPWYHYKKIFDVTPQGRKEKKLVKILHNFTDNIIRKRADCFEVFEDPIDDEDGINVKKRQYPLLDILLNAKFKENLINEKGIREEVNTFMFEVMKHIFTVLLPDDVCNYAVGHLISCPHYFHSTMGGGQGHDTTAMSLMYTCMLLACHQNIQEKVYQEIIEVMGKSGNELSYADLQNMDLLERCIKESLRLYPSVAFIGRQLDSDVSTKYGIIPRGTTCIIHVYDLHRDERYWPNPRKFDPSRHLPENSRGRHPFAYIPFSAGPRNCIGQRFAMLEIKTAICGLIQKFILKPVDTPETLVLTQDMVLRPKNGVKVKFVLRNQ